MQLPLVSHVSSVHAFPSSQPAIHADALLEVPAFDEEGASLVAVDEVAPLLPAEDAKGRLVELAKEVATVPEDGAGPELVDTREDDTILPDDDAREDVAAVEDE